MKHKSILIACITLLTLHLASCRKYLNKKSDNSLVVPATINDARALLDDANLMNGIGPSFGDASSDDYFMLLTTYNSLSTRLQRVYTWLPEDYYYQNDWSDHYKVVYNANLCLEVLSKIPVNVSNEASWKDVKGSALFFRAYCFLNLLWLHSKAFDETSSNSDLGIDLRISSDFNVKSVRSTARDGYERVIQDAKEAVQLLQNNPLHVYRPSKPAAYGLLARAYLSMRQYDSALRYADLSLQIKSELMNYNGDVGIISANMSSGTNSPFEKFNKETIFYVEGNGLTQTLTSSRGKIDSNLYSSYSNSDWRKTAFFAPNSGYYQFKGNYTQSSTHFAGIATDEMYLIRAECYARAGNKDSALSDLNALLIKRLKPPFTPVNAPTAEQALEIVLVERRKELLFRGLRWSDIKRLNKEARNIILTRDIAGTIYILEPNANYYALPLPKDIIDLAGIPQNPL
jgi:tetratricopeptide (TPR) repeat protein